MPLTSLKICNDCYTFLNEISVFCSKSKTVENMFLELLSTEEEFLCLDTLNDIRIKFGLQELILDETELGKEAGDTSLLAQTKPEVDETFHLDGNFEFLI